MIEKTLKTVQGRLTIKIPTHLEELTLGQLIDLQHKPDLNDIEAISILSGIEPEQLQQVKNYNDLMGFSDTVLSLARQLTNLYNHRAIPKAITLTHKGRTVKIPVLQNLSIEPAGAFMASSEVIAEEMNQHVQRYGEDNATEFNPSLKACCQVLAHYFYCRVTGQKYDEYQADEFTEEIKKMKVVEALPISAHFFYCYPNLSKRRISCWQCLRQLWRKKPVFRNFKNSGMSIPSIPSQAATSPNGTIF